MSPACELCRRAIGTARPISSTSSMMKATISQPSTPPMKNTANTKIAMNGRSRRAAARGPLNTSRIDFEQLEARDLSADRGILDHIGGEQQKPLERRRHHQPLDARAEIGKASRPHLAQEDLDAKRQQHAGQQIGETGDRFGRDSPVIDGDEIDRHREGDDVDGEGDEEKRADRPRLARHRACRPAQERSARALAARRIRRDGIDPGIQRCGCIGGDDAGHAAFALEHGEAVILAARQHQPDVVIGQRQQERKAGARISPGCTETSAVT